jgi:hypothetical protein
VPTNLTSKTRDEWIRYEIAVIAQRSVHHPALRGEAREAFVGGAASMYRIFCDEISRIGTPELQTKAIRELGEELRAFALEAGQR